MPQAAFAVDYQIQRGVDQIGHIGGGNDRIFGGDKGFSCGKGSEGDCYKIILIPGFKKGAGANH